MDDYYSRLAESAGYIAEKTAFRPDVAVVLGSGLGGLAGKVADAVELDYSDIPGFPGNICKSSDANLKTQGLHVNPQLKVLGHTGKLISGIISGRHVVLFSGRFHYYQGYDIGDVVFQIRLAKLLGADKLILTNSAGAVNKLFKPGDLMLITDHISLFCPSPLRIKPVLYGGRPLNVNVADGQPGSGTIFCDMSEVYSRRMIDIAQDSADAIGITVRRGVYAYTQGPAYETPADIKALAAMGADAVGMSTVAEAMTANSLGIETLGISVISNMAAGITPSRLAHCDVLSTAAKASDAFQRLIERIISKV